MYIKFLGKIISSNWTPAWLTMWACSETANILIDELDKLLKKTLDKSN